MANAGGSGRPMGAPPRLSHVDATATMTAELMSPVTPTITLYGTRRASHQSTTDAFGKASARRAASRPAVSVTSEQSEELWQLANAQDNVRRGAPSGSSCC